MVKWLKFSLIACICSCNHVAFSEEVHESATPSPTAETDVKRVYKAEEVKPQPDTDEEKDDFSYLPDLTAQKIEPLPELKNQVGVDSEFKHLVGVYLKSARQLEAAVRIDSEKRVLDICLAELRANWKAIDAYGWPEALDERMRLSLVACSQAWELYYWVRLARMSYREVPIDANLYYYRMAEDLLEFIARWDKGLALEMQKKEEFMQHEAPVHDVARRLDAEIISALTGSVTTVAE